MERGLKVEFHCHSTASRDSLTRIEDLLRAARSAGIDRLMLTDHNTIRGALEARRLDPGLVIVSEEVRTTKGELLGYFLTNEVPRGLSPEEAIATMRQQGAFISVPHPFDRRRHGWALGDLERIALLVDAIEIFNSRCQAPWLNRQAADFARSHNLPGTVGSDAHTLPEIGRSTLTLPYFSNAEDLRRVIRQGVAQTRISSPFIHLTSTYARYFKMVFQR